MSESETGGGRRRRRKADTELKTKTPHVNVGNNIYKHYYVQYNIAQFIHVYNMYTQTRETKNFGTF